jgi:hypothetical protein
MKVLPIIAGAGLIYGGVYADGMNVPRESNRPIHHRADEVELDDAVYMPHRPVTIAYKLFFDRMLQAKETDWTITSSSRQKATGNTGDFFDDDPAKKIAFHTIWNPVVPTPFVPWGYTEPDRSPVAPAYPGTLPLGCCEPDPPAPLTQVVIGGGGSGSGIGGGIGGGRVNGVPEPSTWAMGIIGSTMMGIIWWRRRAKILSLA